MNDAEKLADYNQKLQQLAKTHLAKNSLGQPINGLEIASVIDIVGNMHGLLMNEKSATPEDRASADPDDVAQINQQVIAYYDGGANAELADALQECRDSFNNAPQGVRAQVALLLEGVNTVYAAGKKELFRFIKPNLSQPTP